VNGKLIISPFLIDGFFAKNVDGASTIRTPGVEGQGTVVHLRSRTNFHLEGGVATGRVPSEFSFVPIRSHSDGRPALKDAFSEAW